MDSEIVFDKKRILSKVENIFSIITIAGLAIFLISPLIQLLFRIQNMFDSTEVFALTRSQKQYNRTIRATHIFAIVCAAFTYVSFIHRSIKNKCNNKKLIGTMIPFLIFCAFDMHIVIATIVRGPNIYDFSGHPYIYESIFTYLIYPLVYFFCGTQILSAFRKQLLVYLFIVSSIPVCVLGLIDQWFFKIKYFVSYGLCTVFHNSNHYGYYLALLTTVAFLMFVYEKKTVLKLICFFVGIISTISIVINNTLGAYLAVGFTITVFFIYSTIKHENVKGSILILSTYIGITIIMSFWYNTIISSFLTLFSDVGNIVVGSDKSDLAGSGRLGLWKKTIYWITKKPFTGYGVSGLMVTHDLQMPHNEYLQYAAFFGIPASVYYMMAIFVIFFRTMRQKKSAVTVVCFFTCIVYLTSAFFGVTIYYTTPFLFIFLGMTYSEFFHTKIISKELNNYNE